MKAAAPEAIGDLLARSGMHCYRNHCIFIHLIGYRDKGVSMLADGNSSSSGGISVPFRGVSKNALKRIEIKFSQLCAELEVAGPADFHVSPDCLVDSTKVVPS